MYKSGNLQTIAVFFLIGVLMWLLYGGHYEELAFGQGGEVEPTLAAEAEPTAEVEPPEVPSETAVQEESFSPSQASGPILASDEAEKWANTAKELIEAVDGFLSASKELPEAAQESTEAAQESTEGTEESPEGAQESPQVAQESPQVAQESPEAAQESTEAAQESPEVAQESTEAAQESTEAAQESTEVAQESTEVAQESPQAAQESPEGAEESPEAAPESTEAAPESTEAAQESPKSAEESPEATEESSESPEVAEESSESTPESTVAAGTLGDMACFGTFGFGLTCLAESGWTSFNKDNSSLPSNSIWDMAVCPDNRIVMNDFSNVSVFDGQNGVKYEEEFGIILESGVACDANGGIWVAHFDEVSEVSYFDGQSWTTIPPEQYARGDDAAKLTRDIITQPDGQVWIATARTIATTKDGSEWTVYEQGQAFDQPYFFDALATDHQGGVWAAHSDGLLHFDGTDWTDHEAQIETIDIFQTPMVVDHDGKVWVGSLDDGLKVFDGQNWLTYNTQNSELTSNSVQRLAIDAQGGIWVGTQWGVTVINGNNWTTYQMDNAGLADNEISALAVIGGGPPLPQAIDKENGSLSGQLLDSLNNSDEPIADATVEICVVSLNSEYINFPCEGQPLILQTTTDANGRFTIKDVPVGRYVVTAKIGQDQWVQLKNEIELARVGFSQERVLVRAGEETDLSTLRAKTSPNPASQSTVPPSSRERDAASGDMACFGTFGFGVTCLDDATRNGAESGWTFFNKYNSSLPYDSVWDMVVCPDNRIVMNHFSSISVFDGQNWVSYEEEFGIILQSGVACDADGGIWVAHFGGLAYFGGVVSEVSYFDGQSWTTIPSKQFGTGDDETDSAAWKHAEQDITTGPDGQVWVATTHTIATTKDGSEWTVYQQGQGFDQQYFFEALATDNQGGVWAAHSEGLLHFDGTDWTDHEAHIGTSQTPMVVDHDGNLWVGTLDDGLMVFDGQNWVTYNTQNSGLTSDSVQTLAIDARGRMWVGTEWGVTVIDGNNWTTYQMHNAGLADNHISALAVIGRGPPLPQAIDQENGELSGQLLNNSEEAIADATIEICVELLEPSFINFPCEGQPLILQTTTDANGHFTIKDVPVGRYVMTAKMGRDQWVQLKKDYELAGVGLAQERVLVRAGEETDLFRLRVKTSPKSASETTVATSSREPDAVSGDMACFGTLHFGLTCLDQSGWTSFNENNSSLPDDWISDMAVCPDNRIVVPHPFSLGAFDGQKWVSYGQGAEFYFADAIACDANGDIWVAHFEGVSYFNGQNWTTAPSKQLATGDDATDLMEDIAIGPDGQVWVVTAHTIATTSNGRQWTVYQQGQAFDDKHFFDALAIDNQGGVWAAHSRGLLYFDGTNWTDHEAPSSSSFKSLTVDHDGKVWIGTFTDGLMVFDGQNWVTYNTQNSGLISNFVQALAIDGQGRVWVGTEWGVTVIDGNNWTTYQMDNAELADNDISALAVIGSGPPLPQAIDKENGALSGQLLNSDAEPIANTRVELCVQRLSLFFTDSPCEEQPLILQTTTDANGNFSFTDLPVGRYVMTANIGEDEWAALKDEIGLEERILVNAGEETDLSTLILQQEDSESYFKRKS